MEFKRAWYFKLIELFNILFGSVLINIFLVSFFIVGMLGITNTVSVFLITLLSIILVAVLLSTRWGKRISQFEHGTQHPDI